MKGVITRKKASKWSQEFISARKPKFERSEEKVITRRDFIRSFFIFATLGYVALSKRIYDREEISEGARTTISGTESELKNGPHQDPGVVSSPLQDYIERFISEMRQAGKIEPDEKVAWVVHDLIKGRNLVSINQDEPLQSASMIKPIIALAFFHKVSKGELQYTEKSKRYLRLTIQRSRNYTTNWLIDLLGGPERVNEILINSYGDIFQNLEIVEKIPPGGATYRNRASASDYNRFLIALWKDELPYSQEIKRLMSLPKCNQTLGDYPTGAIVMNKTGNTARLCGDMAIVDVSNSSMTCAYTLISIIEKQQSAGHYSRWKRIKKGVIRDGSNIVHEYMRRTYFI